MLMIFNIRTSERGAENLENTGREIEKIRPSSSGLGRARKKMLVEGFLRRIKLVKSSSDVVR